MTAARLDELAVWADGLSAPLHTAGMAEAAQKYADLARCAAAWAKVERMRLSRLDINHVTCTYLFNCSDGKKDYANGDTAISAVEAAPEVKP